MSKEKHTGATGMMFLVVVFLALAFGLLAFRDETVSLDAVLFGMIIIFVMIAEYALLTIFFRYLDRFLLVISDFLVAVGLTVQYRIDPDIAYRQIIMFGIGIAIMIVCMLLMRHPNFFRRLNWLLMAASIAILVLVSLIGQEKYGATNWISFGNFSFQPSEFVKVMTVFILAHWFSGSIYIKGIWPALLYAIIVAGLLVMQRDLGAAVLIAGLTLIVLYVATGKKLLTAMGLLGGMGGAAASYFIFDHVRARVAIWQDPWATYTTSGYQIAQGLMAIASGGWFGMGLTLGSPNSIPVCHTDYIFAAICEEFGIVFGVCLIALYLVFIIRGALIALSAPDRFTMLVAFGCTTLLTLQSFIIIGGVIKLIPLTGITLPFVSYGGSSMLASMMLMGILQGVAIQSGKTLNKALRKKII